mmetsp:Transcript_9761/g.59312  ORF Transcript_9761/g.59312 Transcript_9761/m.59312 type:complete len:245 (-) Transcript_9761:258-992(-)
MAVVVRVKVGKRLLLRFLAQGLLHLVVTKLQGPGADLCPFHVLLRQSQAILRQQAPHPGAAPVARLHTGSTGQHAQGLSGGPHARVWGGIACIREGRGGLVREPREQVVLSSFSFAINQGHGLLVQAVQSSGSKAHTTKGHVQGTHPWMFHGDAGHAHVVHAVVFLDHDVAPGPSVLERRGSVLGVGLTHQRRVGLVFFFGHAEHGFSWCSRRGHGGLCIHAHPQGEQERRHERTADGAAHVDG